MSRAGETFVWGKHQATARALLEACDRLAMPRILVRTTDSGFICPNEIADEAADQLVPPEQTAPAEEL